MPYSILEHLDLGSRSLGQPLQPHQLSIACRSLLGSKLLLSVLALWTAVTGGNGERKWPQAWSVADYHEAYRGGRTDPVSVARKLNENLAASERREPPMKMLISHDPDDVLRQAQQSAGRYALLLKWYFV